MILVKNLKTATKYLGGMINQKGTLNCIKMIFVESNSGKITLKVTDLNDYCIHKIHSEGEQNDIKFTIDPSHLMAGLNCFEDSDYIKFSSIEDHNVIFESHTKKVNVLFYSEDEFPTHELLDNPPKDLEFSTFQNKQLKEILRAMKPSMSTDFTRIALTGMYFHDKKIVATDGHIMSLLNDSSVNFNAILNYKPLKMIVDTKQSVDIAVKDCYAIFYTENVTIYSKVVEGPYPHYQNVMPKTYEKKFIINKDILVNTLKNIDFKNISASLLKFYWVKDKQNLNISYKLNGNVFSKDIPCVWEENTDFEIGYSGKYLLELLNTIDSNDIQFNFNTQLGPTKFHKVGNDSNFNVIMPLRIQDKD